MKILCWARWLLLAHHVLRCHCEDMCCPSDASFGGSDGEEQKAVKKWFESAKSAWLDTDFKNKQFELWDEFDIRKSEDLSSKLNALDPSTAKCHEGFQRLRWDLGYNVFNPNMYDWDDKIAKKGIVAAMQPQSEKNPWYLPLIYAAYSPSFMQEEEIEKMDAAIKEYFKSNKNGLLFLKLAVSGSSGTGIPKCDGSLVLPESNMYRLYPGYSRDALVQCLAKLRTVSEKSYDDRNPALKYGWPGLLVEPGFEHHTEVKAIVIWGRLFAMGAEKPNCCVFYSNNNITFRGFPGDTRKAPDGRSFGTWMQENKALLKDEHLAQVKKIAEGVGKHADYIRVDMFVNTETGKVVVNEVESFFRCNAFALKTDDLTVELMSQIWLAGWKAYQSRPGGIKNVLRPFSQEQLAVATSQGRNGKPSVPKAVCPADGVPTFIYVLSLLAMSLLCFGIGYLVRSKTQSARTIEGTELSATLA